MHLIDPEASWTYGNDPANSERDQVRLESGDCLTSAKICSDAEVTYAIAAESTVMLAAARIAEIAMRKLANHTDQSAEGYSAQLSQRFAQFKQTAEGLRAKYSHDAVPYAGGISADEWDAWREDTDLIQPTFTRKMHDHAGVSSSDAEDN